MKAFLIFSLLLSTPIFAQENDNQDITEGKILAAESLWLKDLEKGLNEKQQKAMALITMVGSLANDPLSNKSDSYRESAEYARIGFAARLQGIREDREAFTRKGKSLDYALLQDYSKRLDKLIVEIQAFLK